MRKISTFWRAFPLFVLLFFFSHVGWGEKILSTSRPFSSQGSKKISDRRSTKIWRSKSRDWWHDAVIYQIFVRSFRDGNGDGIGDLKGVISKLDYLNDGNPRTQGDLGIDAIWLSPIFESPSYHGYDVTNYRRIHRDYGTMQDFRKLVREAHRRGIRIILDLVINHTSSQHPWFREAASSPRSSKRSWYIWRSSDPHWTQPWNSSISVWHSLGKAFFYGLFWRGMPDLNLRHPAVKKEIASITRYWLNRGVDGFRLDAARYLFADGSGKLQADRPLTHRFWRSYRRFCKKNNPQTLLLGEIWSSLNSIASYCRGDEFDLAFHFPLSKAIFDAVTSMSHEPLLPFFKSSSPLRASCAALFLSNHDQERIFSQLNGQLDLMRMATWLLLTLPGTPVIYYGEEVHLPNAQGHDDRAKRAPMPWDASKNAGFSPVRPWYPLAPTKTNVLAQQKRPSSLWHLYRSLIALRHRFVALRRGKMKLISHLVAAKKSSSTLVFLREFAAQKVIVLLNLNDEPVKALTFTLPPKVARLIPLFREKKSFCRALASHRWRCSLAASGALLLSVEELSTP